MKQRMRQSSDFQQLQEVQKGMETCYLLVKKNMLWILNRLFFIHVDLMGFWNGGVVWLWKDRVTGNEMRILHEYKWSLTMVTHSLAYFWKHIYYYTSPGLLAVMMSASGPCNTGRFSIVIYSNKYFLKISGKNQCGRASSYSC